MNVTDLRRLAKEATPGPWHSDGIARAEIDNDVARYADLVRVPTQDGRALAATWAWPVFDRREQAVANAAYIAAASPDVILGLLDRIAELETAPVDAERLARAIYDDGLYVMGSGVPLEFDVAARKIAEAYARSSKVETGVEK